MIPVTDDLIFEVDDNHLMLRRSKDAITISPSEVRVLLDGLVDAAARLVSRQHHVTSDATETAESVGVLGSDSDK